MGFFRFGILGVKIRVSIIGYGIRFDMLELGDLLVLRVICFIWDVFFIFVIVL